MKAKQIKVTCDTSAHQIVDKGKIVFFTTLKL